MWSCWKNITAPDGTLYTKKAVNHRCIIGLKMETDQRSTSCCTGLCEGTESVILRCRRKYNGCRRCTFKNWQYLRNAATKRNRKKEIPADTSITFENVSFRYKGASKDEILSHEVQDGTTMMDNQGYDIAFKNVGFSYNIGDAVLKDVTFTAKQGEVTALIGPPFWMKQRRLWM